MDAGEDRLGGNSNISSCTDSAVLIASICADTEELAVQVAPPKTWGLQEAAAAVSAIAADAYAPADSCTEKLVHLPPILRVRTVPVHLKVFAVHIYA